MKTIIKLNLFNWDETKNEQVLIGIESIIDAQKITMTHPNGKTTIVTRIHSRGGMMETNYVKESVDEIFEMINN